MKEVRCGIASTKMLIMACIISLSTSLCCYGADEDYLGEWDICVKGIKYKLIISAFDPERILGRMISVDPGECTVTIIDGSAPSEGRIEFRRTVKNIKQEFRGTNDGSWMEGEFTESHPDGNKTYKWHAVKTSPSISPLYGAWLWHDGKTHRFYANGRVDTVKDTLKGTWRSNNNATFTIKWSNGDCDIISVYAQGCLIKGKNQTGAAVSGKRFAGSR